MIDKRFFGVDPKTNQPHLLYTPFTKQIQFHEETTPNLVAIGSRGSGKSHLLRMDAHMRCLSVPNINVALVRKSLKDLKKSHINYIDREMYFLGGDYHATDYVARYPNGSKLFFSYVGSEGDSLNLLGAEFIAAYFDELSVIPWDYFLKLAASVRVPLDSGLKGVIRAATNPYGPSAYEVNKYFVTKEVDPSEDEEYFPGDWKHIQINMEDNPYLDIKDYKKRLVGLDPQLKKAWLEGEYSEEDALFDWHPKKNGKPYHVIPELDLAKVIKGGFQIFRAIDVGWYPDPTIVLWIAHLGNRFIVFKEKLWNKTIVEDIARDIKEIDESLGLKRVAMTFCDPSMDINTVADVRTIKDQFELFGIPMEASINNRELYASSMHTALMTEVAPGVPKIQIVDGSSFTKLGCPYLIKSIPNQRYDQKRPLAMANTSNDHGVVALAYFLISGLASDKRDYTPTTPRKWMVEKTNRDRWILGSENVRSKERQDY